MPYFPILNHLIKETTKLFKHVFCLFLQSKCLIATILPDHMIFIKHLVDTQSQVPIFIDNC